MSEDIAGNVGRAESINTTLEAMQATRKEEMRELSSEQLSSKIAYQDALAEVANPFAMLRRTQKDIKTHSSRVQKMLKTGEKEHRLTPIEQIKDQAGQFQRRNPELQANALILLRERVKPGDTKEDILKILQEFYPDVALADEALEFLFATTDGELAKTIRELQEEFKKDNQRQIAAGRNIGTLAREASNKGLGSPTSLRDLYRDVTGNPRDSTTLFQELSQRYEFKELKKVTDFLFHSLGADLKSKGPSIAPGQLHRLITETRSLQAILGVYRFFKSRMPLVGKMFEREGLDLPDQLNFESLAKAFMGLVGERYPSGDKVLQTAVRLGIEKWITAKIIAFSQLRDAIREVAMNQIYRSLQHRDELYLAILDALEELEDELEALMERRDEEEEGGEEEEQDEAEEDEEENEEDR